MKKDLFNNIGKVINEYQSPVDLDQEWNGILNRQQRKRKRRFFWMFSLCFVLLCTLAYLRLPYPESDNAAEVLKQDFNWPEIEQAVTPSAHSVLDIQEDKNTLSAEAPIASLSPKRSSVSGIKSTSVNLTPHQIIAIQSSFTKKANEQESLLIDHQNSSVKKRKSTEEMTKETKVTKTKMLASLPSSLPTLTTPKPYVEDLSIINVNTPAPQAGIQLFFNSGLAVTPQKIRAKEIGSEEYSQLRSSSETPLETYTFDIGVNIPLGKKSFVSIGGNYNISYDRVNHAYNVPKAFDFENVLVKRRIYMPSGTAENVFGDTTITGSQTLSITQFNKYTSTNLNVSLGRYLLSTKRFSIAATGGLFYNLSLNTSGKVISSENPQGALVELAGYKKSFGLGLIGGLDFDYKISKSLTLNLRPIASYGLSSATEEANVLKSNFYKYGASIGIKYNLAPKHIIE